VTRDANVVAGSAILRYLCLAGPGEVACQLCSKWSEI
jgi:hypothetical protein